MTLDVTVWKVDQFARLPVADGVTPNTRFEIRHGPLCQLGVFFADFDPLPDWLTGAVLDERFAFLFRFLGAFDHVLVFAIVRDNAELQIAGLSQTAFDVFNFGGTHVGDDDFDPIRSKGANNDLLGAARIDPVCQQRGEYFGGRPFCFFIFVTALRRFRDFVDERHTTTQIHTPTRRPTGPDNNAAKRDSP